MSPRSFHLTLAGLLCAAGCTGSALLGEIRAAGAARRALAAAAPAAAGAAEPAAGLADLERQRPRAEAALAAARADFAASLVDERAASALLEGVLAANRERAAEARFALELVEVTAVEFPLRLAGVTGQVAILEFTADGERIAARVGEWIGSTRQVLRGLATRRIDRREVPVALLRHDGTGAETELALGGVALEPDPSGLFAAPGGAVRLRPGDTLERAGVTYAVCALSLAPARAEIDWRAGPGPGESLRHRVLTVDPVMK